MLASILYATSLFFLGKIVSSAGMFTLFYSQSGVFISSVCYFTYKATQNYRESDVFWVDVNLKKDGKIWWKNVLSLVTFVCVHLSCHQLAYLSVWAAYQSKTNPGIICVIWLINPIMMSIGDLILFGQKLKLYHIIGIISIVVCGSIISLSKNVETA